MINSGTDFHKRLYMQLKDNLLELLDCDNPHTAKELCDRLNELGTVCSLQQVVLALSALRDERKARPYGHKKRAHLWYKTSDEFRNKMRRSDGAVKVYRMDDCNDG